MTVLYWLLVPLVVTVVAALWIGYAHRTRPRVEPKESMAEHERFRLAMERQASRPAAPTGDDTAPSSDADSQRPG